MSPLVFTEDHLLPPSTEKLRLLKLWMRIQNRFFFPPNDDLILLLQASAPSTTEKTALSTSQTCHLGVEWRTATTTNGRWCHSLRKKAWRAERERDEGAGAAERQRTCRRNEREELVMSGFWSSGSSKGFVWNLWRSSRRWGLKTRHSHTNYTPHSTVRLSHDVITFWTRLFFFCFFLAALHRILPHKLYWSALPMSQVQLQPKGPRQHILESDSVLVIPDYFNLCDELPTISCHSRRLHSVYRSIQNNHHLSWA